MLRSAAHRYPSATQHHPGGLRAVATHRADDVIRDADTAMCVAKDRGRTHFELYNADLRERVTERVTIEAELREALSRIQLWVTYQPKINLESGETVDVDGLLRWDHPARIHTTASFIPIAEDTGLIGPIGQLVLRDAVQQTAAWAARARPT